MITNVKISVEGYYTVQVVQGGIIVHERKRSKNMILNQGKNNFFSGNFPLAGAFAFCAAGSGSTAVAATDTGLETEIKRTNTYLTGAGNCGTTIAGRVVTLRRTFDFPAESGSVNYRELGFSNSGATAANLWSRVIISGGVVSLTAGQNLRVVYDLEVTFSPSSQQTGAITISGWPVPPATTTNATWDLQEVPIASVSTAGVVSMVSGIEPYSGTVTCTSYTGAITLSSFGSASSGGSAISNSHASASWDTYSSGSFTRTCTFAYCTPSSFSSTSIKAFKYGNFLTIIFNDNQTKTNSYRLRYNGLALSLS